MAVGLGRLRLPPAAFWAMTPRELGAAVRGLYPDAPASMRREGFDELLKRYPDDREPSSNFRRSAPRS